MWCDVTSSVCFLHPLHCFFIANIKPAKATTTTSVSERSEWETLTWLPLWSHTVTHSCAQSEDRAITCYGSMDLSPSGGPDFFFFSNGWRIIWIPRLKSTRGTLFISWSLLDYYFGDFVFLKCHHQVDFFFFSFFFFCVTRLCKNEH